MDSITIIRPRRRFHFLNLPELVRYRELFLTLAWRDIKVRYKQTLIGGLWAILQPLLTMIVFSFFFGKIAKIPSEGIPYPAFSYTGLILWTFFTTAITNASNSMINNAHIIGKVYFPRLILPFSATLVAGLDYMLASIVVLGLLLYYQIIPSINILLLPIIVVITWVLANGVGLWLAALNVKYRDVRYVVPFFIQLMVFVTPVIYPTSVSGNYKWVVMLNPMSGLLEAHRAFILGHQPIPWEMLGYSLALTIVIFFTGLTYFRSVERYFADVI